MKSAIAIILTMTGLLLVAPGFGQNPERSQGSSATLSEFLKHLEDRPEAISRWEDVRDEAQKFGIDENISMEEWRQLLELASKSGLKSRMVLQLHPACRKRAYFDEMVHVLGHDSDLFTRWRILGFMIENYPDDRRTPKYGLLLLLENWTARWPEGINLHGNSPREALELTLSGEWGISFSDWRPETCAQLLAQSDKWVFDKKTATWSVAK